MRIFGWRSAVLSAGIITVVVAMTVWAAARPGTIGVDQAYHTAAASVIPLLLFSQMVRLDPVRETIVSGRRRLDVSRAEDEEEPGRAADQSSSSTLELVAGYFVTMLLFIAVGIGPVMVVLGDASRSPVTLLLTATATGWGLIGMLAFEALLFADPRA